MRPAVIGGLPAISVIGAMPTLAVGMSKPRAERMLTS